MFKDGEQQVLDTYEDVLNELKENITRDVKPVVENNPNRPCFMEETRSLFGVKEETKEEQRPKSTLKRRKSADI